MSATAASLDIAHVVENLERGGLERMVIDLALAQRAAGHRPRVACRGGLRHGGLVVVVGPLRCPVGLLRRRRLAAGSGRELATLIGESARITQRSRWGFGRFAMLVILCVAT